MVSCCMHDVNRRDGSADCYMQVYIVLSILEIIHTKENNLVLSYTAVTKITMYKILFITICSYCN